MTYRHAVKDADNNVPFGETLPVHYNALAGLTVEETERLQDYDAFPVVGSGVFEGVEGTGGIFCDIGLVELELIPGTRNKKRILLTDAGRELEKNTTDRLRGAVYFPTAPFLFVRKKLVNKTRVCKNRHKTDAEAS